MLGTWGPILPTALLLLGFPVGLCFPFTSLVLCLQSFHLGTSPRKTPTLARPPFWALSSAHLHQNVVAAWAASEGEAPPIKGDVLSIATHRTLRRTQGLGAEPAAILAYTESTGEGTVASAPPQGGKLSGDNPHTHSGSFPLPSAPPLTKEAEVSWPSISLSRAINHTKRGHRSLCRRPQNRLAIWGRQVSETT
jgi:hypothetical protein